MILKIQDTVIKSKWYYYDNITSISFNHNEYFITEENLIFERDFNSTKSPRLDVNALYAQWIRRETEDDPTQCEVIVTRFHSSYDLNGKGRNELCIAFNSRAYLLNDEGKTIERIS